MQADREVHRPESDGQALHRLRTLELAQADHRHPKRERDRTEEHSAHDQQLLSESDAPRSLPGGRPEFIFVVGEVGAGGGVGLGGQW